MKLRILIVTLCMTFLVLPMNVAAKTLSIEENYSVNNLAEMAEKTPRADIIEWRFKNVNGKRYCRQYNVTKGVWIGQWQLC